MQDDISDGVLDLIKRGVVDGRRVCIVGASYGGYAALWGIVKTPALYRCGVSLAGVSDLQALLSDRDGSDLGAEGFAMMRRRIGNASMTGTQIDAVSPISMSIASRGRC